MRFIHTADIRLDRSYAEQALPAHAGRENRGHLRRRLQQILDRAVEWQADGLLIAGNLFDLENVERDTVAFLRSAFEAIAPIPVCISPGNRDPFVTQSPYATELWPENVHLFAGPAWSSVEIGDVAVHGFGYDGHGISINPFDHLPPLSPEVPAIVMASAIQANMGQEDTTGCAVVDINQLDQQAVTYLALGQWPTAMSTGMPEGPVAWYAGSPEGGGFDEPGPHHYLEITLASAGNGGDGGVKVMQVPISTGRFFEMTVDCTDLDSGQALLDAIRPHLTADDDRQCVRVTMEGALLPAIYDELTSIREALEEDVLYLDLADRCFVAENYEELARQKTSLGAFVARISSEIEDAPDDRRRAALYRSRDLALCAYRGQHLPIRASQGD